MFIIFPPGNTAMSHTGRSSDRAGDILEGTIEFLSHHASCIRPALDFLTKTTLMKGLNIQIWMT